MPLIINTNVQSLNSQRQLVKSGMEMSTAMERLSSGKRINGAGDDAAGLAIASRMTSQVRGLTQAVRNANDGISLIQTAGGALEESTNILQRMRELAIQSANGIYTDANRTSLNAELDQLKSELTRIAETTSFNGLRILDGTLGEIALQVGSEANQTIGINIGSGFDAESLGASDTTTGTGSYTLSESTNAVQSGDPGSLNSLSDGDLVINGVAVPAAESYDTVSTSDNGASALGIAEAINSVSDQTGVVATASNEVNLGGLTVESTVQLEFTITTGGALVAGDFTINGQDVLGTLVATGTDNNQSLVDAINTSGITGITASLNDTDEVVLTNTDGGDILIGTAGLSTATVDMTAVDNGGSKLGTTEVTFDTKPGTTAAVTGNVVTTGTTLGDGDLVINGQDFTGSVIKTNDDLLAAINAKSDLSGVTASLNGSGELVLSSVDGRNIQVTTDGGMVADTGNTSVIGSITLDGLDQTVSTDNVYSGTVTMSGSSIELSGNDTSGFTTSEVVSALQTTAGTSASATLTVTGQSDGATAFQLNGVDLSYTSATDANTAAAALAAAINGSTELTGVSATYTAGTATMTLNAGVGTGISFVTNDTSTDTVALTAPTDGGSANNDLFGSTTGASVVDVNTNTTFTAPTNGDLTINGYTVDFDGFTTSAANEKSTVAGESSAMFIAAAINSTSGLNDEVTATASTVMNLGEVTATENNPDDQFTLIINGLVVDIDNAVLAGDTNNALTGALNNAFAAAATADENGDAAGLVASTNADGELIITADDGRNITVSVGGTANSESFLGNFDVTTAGSVTAKGSVSLSANEGFQLGEVAGANPALAGISTAAENVANADISTQAGAQAAITVFDRAIDTINTATGALGAANNRLDFTVANLSSIIENATASRSAIMDADFAAETAALSRAQVLQQAASAMLAQANALPSQVLSLLR